MKRKFLTFESNPSFGVLSSNPPIQVFKSTQQTSIKPLIITKYKPKITINQGNNIPYLSFEILKLFPPLFLFQNAKNNSF